MKRKKTLNWTKWKQIEKHWKLRWEKKTHDNCSGTLTESVNRKSISFHVQTLLLFVMKIRFFCAPPFILKVKNERDCKEFSIFFSVKQLRNYYFFNLHWISFSVHELWWFIHLFCFVSFFVCLFLSQFFSLHHCIENSFLLKTTNYL